MHHLDGAKPIKKRPKEISYIQVIRLLQKCTGRKLMSWKEKCCPSIDQKMPTLRKSELREILSKINPIKFLRIIRKLRASTYGPVNKWCWQVMVGVGVVNANARGGRIHHFCDS